MAIDEHLAIIDCGDLHDQAINEQAPIGFFCQQMDRLQREKLAYMFVQGNHDHQLRPWPMVHRWPEWLDFRKCADDPKTHTGCMPLGGLTVQGFDWHPSAEIEACMELVYKDTQVLVMHQVSELMGSIRIPELVFGQVPYVPLLVIGDYHSHEQHIYKGKQGQDLTVLSPGSTCMQAINEEPQKHIYRLYDDLSYESVELKTRIVLRAPSILDGEALEAFIGEVEGQLQKAWDEAHDMGLPENMRLPIIIVPYNPLISDAYRRIKRAVGEKGHLFDDAQLPPTQEREERKAARQKITSQGLVGCLDLVCDPVKEPQVHAYIKTLLECKDPQGAIREKRKEFDLDQRRLLADTE